MDEERGYLISETDFSHPQGDKTVLISQLHLAELLSLAASNGLKDFCINLIPEAGEIPRSHPYKIKQALQASNPYHQHISDCFFPRRGGLLIKTQSLDCALHLIKIPELCGVRVKAVSQTDNFTSRFLLRNVPLEVELIEIVRELADNNLVCKEVRRFTRKDRDGNVFPTETLLVSILGINLPPKIKLWYQIQTISLFIDRPRQCGKCFKYNHVTKYCQSPALCVNCGGSHTVETCSVTKLSCVNCMKEHPATDKECPSREQEQKFLTFKCENRLSFPEARRRYNTLSSTPSYANITKKSNDTNNSTVDLQNFFQTHTTMLSATIQTAFQQFYSQLVPMFADLKASFLSEKQRPCIDPIIQAEPAPKKHKPPSKRKDTLRLANRPGLVFPNSVESMELSNDDPLASPPLATATNWHEAAQGTQRSPDDFHQDSTTTTSPQPPDRQSPQAPNGSLNLAPGDPSGFVQGISDIPI